MPCERACVAAAPSSSLLPPWPSVCFARCAFDAQHSPSIQTYRLHKLGCLRAHHFIYGNRGVFHIGVQHRTSRAHHRTIFTSIRARTRIYEGMHKELEKESTSSSPSSSAVQFSFSSSVSILCCAACSITEHTLGRVCCVAGVGLTGELVEFIEKRPSLRYSYTEVYYHYYYSCCYVPNRTVESGRLAGTVTGLCIIYSINWEGFRVCMRVCVVSASLRSSVHRSTQKHTYSQSWISERGRGP